MILQILASYFDKAVYDAGGCQDILIVAASGTNIDWISCRGGSLFIYGESRSRHLYTDDQFQEDAARAASLGYNDTVIREINIEGL